MFSSVEDAIESVDEQMREFVGTLKYVQATDLGLDGRAAYRLWVSNDAIIVDAQHDRTLQYYGGFEYVEPENRKELGDYVIYLANSDRVQDHLDNLENTSE